MHCICLCGCVFGPSRVTWSDCKVILNHGLVMSVCLSANISMSLGLSSMTCRDHFVWCLSFHLPVFLSSSQTLLIITLYYRRATRCRGDIVTLLWFRLSVCPTRFDLVKTKLLCPYSSNLADMFAMTRG